MFKRPVNFRMFVLYTQTANTDRCLYFMISKSLSPKTCLTHWTIGLSTLLLRYLRPFQKPLNRYLYIPYSSYHPAHAKKSFIKAELIRYVRLSSQKSDFLQIRKKFMTRLRNRGYPLWFLEPIFSSILYENRDSFLRERKSSKDGRNNTVYFKTFRNPVFDGINLKNIFTSNIGQEFNITVCYKATTPLPKFAIFRAT